MNIKITAIAICSLVAVMGLGTMINVPAFAIVSHAEIDKDVFLINDSFTISGTVTDEERVDVYIFIDGPGIGAPEQAQTRTDDNKKFSKSLTASNYFERAGTYTIDVFTAQKSDAIIIEVINDGEKITTLGKFDLILEPIGNKQIDATERLTFTASVTESGINETYSLVNAPNGATINSATGLFSWTPTSSQAGGYIFDIVVSVGPVEDRETIQVTVNQKPDEPEPEPEPKIDKPIEIVEDPVVVEPQKPKELGIATFVDETVDPQTYVDRYNNEATYKAWFDNNFPEYDSIYEAVGLKAPVPLAVFVDPAVDPQTYVDRYNSEATYKSWFDNNFPEYDSIYEAVGLKAPVPLAVFVDPAVDPQTYVDRYNSEATYKSWFDNNFPEYDSIYEAVGLEDPGEITQVDGTDELEIGECGEGTDLVDGYCLIIEQPESGGGCLIATATYGSELAPQVQLLREIRDGQLMGTDSGTLFMTGFNQLYYSFSPTIADMERANPAFKEVVKLTITPLLSSLAIMSYAETESEVLGYGIGVILMNIGMYVAAPAIIILKARRYINV